MSRSLKLAVGIATVGRPKILAETLRQLARQTRMPDMVFVCPARPEDFDQRDAADLPFPVTVVRGRLGLCGQRNTILDASAGFDLMIFFDDDYFPSRAFLEEAERCFGNRPDTVAASGRVIADGVTGPGIDVAAARAILASDEARKPAGGCVEQYAAYGCNMVVRLAPIHAHGLRFDEDLPLYGWLEDIDFCRRLAPFGRIVKNQQMAGIHLGHKGGRPKGLPLGYSQIANPLYLCRKGSYRLDHALENMAKNFAANCGKLFWPEPWVDRRGRLGGNLLALADLLRGRLDPRRVRRLS